MGVKKTGDQPPKKENKEEWGDKQEKIEACIRRDTHSQFLSQEMQL